MGTEEVQPEGVALVTRDEAFRAYRLTGADVSTGRKAQPVHVQEAARKDYDACVALDERLTPVAGNGGIRDRMRAARARNQPRRSSAWDPEPR